ncbi:MAG: hypothetical protein ABJN40_15580 [Sneathiella sp.]
MVLKKVIFAVYLVSVVAGSQAVLAGGVLAKKEPSARAASTLDKFVQQSRRTDGDNDVDVTCTHTSSNPNGCDEFNKLCAKYDGDLTAIPPDSYHCHIDLPSHASGTNSFKSKN